jgi:hypothetical protein
LLRNRPAYEERFGTDAYEAMLTGSLWGVDQMIGKLNPALLRPYLLELAERGVVPCFRGNMKTHTRQGTSSVRPGGT